MPLQPTIHTVILSSFTAEGLTPQDALTQPRRAEVILRHDPFAASPYIVTLSSPAFAFDGSGKPAHSDHVWNFATFNEARAWFDELFEANCHMIAARQRPPEREESNGAKPWRVGDAAILSRLIPYDTWLTRTRFKLDETAAQSQPAVGSAPAERDMSLELIEDNKSFFSFGN